MASLGDRFGRRNVIAGGWMLGGLTYSAMLFAPHQVMIVVALYRVGQFFLIGPYSCLLFFVGESYSPRIRGTGSAILAGLGPIGAIAVNFGAATVLGNHGTWQTSAFWFGAVPWALSGVVILFGSWTAAEGRGETANDAISVAIDNSSAQPLL